MDVSSSEVTADRTMADGYDVIVAGAGLAGHVAALTAAEAGATVCLLEKGDEYGGSSVRAGGGLVFVGTDRQREAGIDDSDDALRKDLTTAGGGVARAELIDAYVDNQLDTYEWMVAPGTVGCSSENGTPAGSPASTSPVAGWPRGCCTIRWRRTTVSPTATARRSGD